jgi:hypothetical protein
MAQLSTKIKKYLADNGVNSVDFTMDVLLQDDSNGQGPYIKEWNIDGVAKPTSDQLDAFETAANTDESNAQVVATRKALYGSIETQIENIIENGLEAEQTRVNQIKADNPKS